MGLETRSYMQSPLDPDDTDLDTGETEWVPEWEEITDKARERLLDVVKNCPISGIQELGVLIETIHNLQVVTQRAYELDKVEQGMQEARDADEDA